MSFDEGRCFYFSVFTFGRRYLGFTGQDFLGAGRETRYVAMRVSSSMEVHVERKSGAIWGRRALEEKAFV